jgi:hypothetical protein
MQCEAAVKSSAEILLNGLIRKTKQSKQIDRIRKQESRQSVDARFVIRPEQGAT